MNVPALARGSLRLYLAHPVQFLAISLVWLPPNALFLITDGELLWWLQSFVWPFVTDFGFATLTFAAGAAARGQAPGILESYRAALSRLGKIVSVTFRYFGAFMLLVITIIGIPFAVSLFVRWFFGIQGVMLRDLEPKEALHLSSDIVEGRWWRVLGVITLVAIAASPLGVLSGLLWWGPVLTSWPREVRMVIPEVAGAVVAPLVACFYALLFLRLAERVEEPAEMTTT